MGLVIAATRFSAALQLGSPKFVSVPTAAASMVPSPAEEPRFLMTQAIENARADTLAVSSCAQGKRLAVNLIRWRFVGRSLGHSRLVRIDHLGRTSCCRRCTADFIELCPPNALSIRSPIARTTSAPTARACVYGADRQQSNRPNQEKRSDHPHDR